MGLNGTLLGGSQISVVAAPNSQDGSKLRVHGVPPGMQWQDVKDHFSTIGTVAFCNVMESSGPPSAGCGQGKGGTFSSSTMPMMQAPSAESGFAEVRYNNPDDAARAIQTLNGTFLDGAQISV